MELAKVALLLLFSVGISASTIKGPPTASKRNLQQLARIGQEIKLLCPMEGHPVPIIEWSKEDEAIDYQWTRYRANKKTLKIKDVQKSDTGRFVCKGINGFGKEQIEIDLIVIDPKDFPGLPEGELPDVTSPVLTEDTITAKVEFEKTAEENFRISCSAIGKPEPKITWYKNGHELLENVREKHGRSILHIRNLMQRDTGTYTCKAKNMVGEQQKDFRLRVEEVELIEHPEFPHGPMNRTVEQGDTATFDCRVRSSAMPHIKWLKKLEAGWETGNQSHVIPVGDDKYRLIHNSVDIPVKGDSEYLSQLNLPEVNARDAGMYICFVTNPRGGFNYRPAFLTVIPRTETRPESPLILILVISFVILVIFLLTGVTICVVKRRQKEPLSEAGEVSHNLMPASAQIQPNHETLTKPYMMKPEQPLPPPPTPTQWTHMYGGGQQTYTDSSHYDGNQYEVPHHHGGKTPAPSLRYGFTSYPSENGHIYIPQHVMPVYYPDNRPTV